MKPMWNNRIASLLLLVLTAVGISCTKNELTDGDKFMLFYPDITDIGPSTDMDITPTYHGAKPTDFNVYNVKYNGSTIQTDCFQIDPLSGRLMIKETENLGVGVYTISISCKSSGTLYEFPDFIKVNMMKAVPEGITVEPSEIVLLMTQVNNVNSTETLPTAQVTTDGNHVSVKSYRIANVTRDGVRMEDWAGFFSIDEETGLISIIKNGTFVAGTYHFDLRLVTTAANASSEEGIFTDALTVDIVSPPVSLVYDPEVKRVEEGSGYVSAAPSFVASTKDLKFEIKAFYPENVPLTIDQSTGVISLAAENGLVSGDEVQISIKVSNAYGSKDFDQVTRIEIVDYIQPISKLSYNDSTVWHGTAYGIKPLEVDGDDVKFSFVNLPEVLAEELSIDEFTGKISAVKGNKIEKGEYTITVKVANDKGEMTENITLSVVDNPYYFTKVSWGNNLGLTPIGDYASQYRIKTFTDNIAVALDKANSDITETGWQNVSFVIVGGSVIKNTDAKPTYAQIDANTGDITVLPSKIQTSKIANVRGHVILVEITCGAGTSGETVRKVPVFFDFNILRQDSSQPNAPAYTVEFTPFVFQCNPSKGGTFVQPTFKDAEGNLVDPVVSQITMTMHGPNQQYYWNIDGPASHLDGIPSTDGGFLHVLWEQYAKDAGSSVNYANAYPVYKYLEDGKALYASARLGYMQDDLTMLIKKDKWIDRDGNYADGVFVSQVRMGYTGLDGTVKRADATTSPYNNMFPFFIWFDTEF